MAKLKSGTRIYGTATIDTSVVVGSAVTLSSSGINVAGIIDFGTAGVAAPTFTTRSAGTKIVLFPALSGSASDYAFGIETSTLWSSVPSTAEQFKWYGGTTLAATLSGTGNLTVPTSATSPIVQGSVANSGTITVRGTSSATKATASVLMNEGVASSSTTTGTLVVTGGVGISGNLYVGGGTYADYVALTAATVTGNATTAVSVAVNAGSVAAVSFAATTTAATLNITSPIAGQEVIIYAANGATYAKTVTIQVGGVTVPAAQFSTGTAVANGGSWAISADYMIRMVFIGGAAAANAYTTIT